MTAGQPRRHLPPLDTAREAVRRRDAPRAREPRPSPYSPDGSNDVDAVEHGLLPGQPGPGDLVDLVLVDAGSGLGQAGTVGLRRHGQVIGVRRRATGGLGTWWAGGARVTRVRRAARWVRDAGAVGPDRATRGRARLARVTQAPTIIRAVGTAPAAMHRPALGGRLRVRRAAGRRAGPATGPSHGRTTVGRERRWASPGRHARAAGEPSPVREPSAVGSGAARFTRLLASRPAVAGVHGGQFGLGTELDGTGDRGRRAGRRHRRAVRVARQRATVVRRRCHGARVILGMRAAPLRGGGRTNTRHSGMRPGRAGGTVADAWRPPAGHGRRRCHSR